MPGPNRRMVVALAFSLLLLVPHPVLGYAGPGAGLELVGYFMGLVAWGALVLSAVVMWPVTALLRFLRGAKPEPNAEPKTDQGAGVRGQESDINRVTTETGQPPPDA